jgi:hypothetical protein
MSDQWVTAVVTCTRCTRSWQAVYLSRIRLLECPFCEKFSVWSPQTALRCEAPKLGPKAEARPPRVPWVLTDWDKKALRSYRIDVEEPGPDPKPEDTAPSKEKPCE